MLASAGLGNEPGCSHAAGQQPLANSVVDLVCARVVEILTFQIDTRACCVRGQEIGSIQWRGTADVVTEQSVHLTSEGWVIDGLLKGGIQPVQDRLCLLYTSDAADEEDSVDLGGRRIIKK